MSSSTEGRIVVGRIGRPHGRRGEVTVLSDSNDPERFVIGATFLTDRDRKLVIRAVRPNRDRGFLIGFEAVRTRHDAERLRGAVLMVDATGRRNLGAGEFWPEDLAGLAAVTPDGDTLGRVLRVEFGPGQDRLIVGTAAGAEVQVPFVSEIVGDPAEGRIVIDAPEGLF